MLNLGWPFSHFVVAATGTDFFPTFCKHDWVVCYLSGREVDARAVLSIDILRKLDIRMLDAAVTSSNFWFIGRNMAISNFYMSWLSSWAPKGGESCVWIEQ